ncbi:MAG TPA: TonB family protein, partial [Burkholderiaceae bacterium]|nr:TonB family protein [Burkholderiaceae bacterium]
TSIRFTVDSHGMVSKAEVVKSAGSSREHRLLDRAAVEALSKCPFKPGTDENGNPVGGFATVEYVWKLE